MIFSPDGQTLAGGGFDGKISLWDLAGGNLKNTLVSGSDKALIAFSPDGNTLISGSYAISEKTGDYAGEIKFWDTASGNLKRLFATQRAGINSVAVSPDGQTLAVGNSNGTISLWRLE